MSDAPFELFWHRLGNQRAGVLAVDRARREGPTQLAGRPVRHGLELDLKWTGPGPFLYAYHGPTGRQVLGEAAARRRGLPLDDLFALPGASQLSYLIELKCGHGPPRPALERLARTLRAAGAEERTWIAASSLELLDLAAAVLPNVRRVLFGSLLGGGRVLHKPTTRIRASLRAAGLAPRLNSGRVQVVCPIGLWERSLTRHRVLAAGARRAGLGYLPGRVVGLELLRGLAADDHPAAFVYNHPARLRLSE